MSVSIATYDDRCELEDNRTKKKQKETVVYYPTDPFMFCKCCQDLENRDPEHMPDLNEYLYHSVEDDEEANLRIARYYKKWIETGGFVMDCPPFVDGGYAGFIFNKEHFVNYPDFETMCEDSVQAGIKKYKDQTGNQVELVETSNVSVGKVGCQMVFFLTLELESSVVEKGTSEPVDQGTICNVTCESSDPVDQRTTTSNVDTYQSIVSYDVLIESCKVLVFRRKSDGKDLIKPDSTFDAITRFDGPVPKDTILLIRFMMP
ncbi:hypothetical protein LINPERHAP1_LOCUS35570 [Linum perenne]